MKSRKLASEIHGVRYRVLAAWGVDFRFHYLSVFLGVLGGLGG
jgi:hypothetical protein